MFLDSLDTKKTFPPKAIKAIGKLYEFDSSENAEIRNRFYRIALRSGPEYAKDAAGKSLPAPTCMALTGSLGDQQGSNEVLSTHLQGYLHPGSRVGQEDFLGTQGFLRELSILFASVLLTTSTPSLGR